MKRYLLLLAISVASLRAELQFAGFFITANDSRFAVTDLENHESSGWLKVGQAFRGYTLVAFDRERDVLSLKKDGQILELHLRDSKVKNEKMTVSGTITLGLNDQVDVIRASLVLGEESIFPLKDGMKLYLASERQADGNIRYRARFVAMDKDGAEQILSAPTVVALPGKPFGIQVGKLGFSFKP